AADAEPEEEPVEPEDDSFESLNLDQLLELEEAHLESEPQSAPEEDISLDDLLSGMVAEHGEQTGQDVEADETELEPELEEQQEPVTATPQEQAVDAPEFCFSDIDEEMAEIFLDEAQELIESANAMLEKWLAEGDNNQMTGLMRNLHTIKGGARMSEIQPVGDIAHELEYMYDGVLEGRFSNSDGLTNLLHAAHDELTNQIEQLSDRQNIRQPLQLIERLQQFRRDGYVADSA